MNANELADALEKDPRRWTILEGAITMLRQQQAEIEKLKKQLAQAQRVYDFDNPLLDKGTIEMNNKPVVWEGAEEWESLAWELCADECGEESCMDLIWDMGVIPEPWGERWQKYEDEAKRMISMVRKCTHPVKEQLSNGHLSDCAIHNEPASRNKPCDCGFEPKFNLSDLKHEDNCRYFDDGEFCTCGAEDSALVDWYRHKEETHPVKEQDCYGDGNVYRGVRSKDSEVQTIHIGGVKELTDEEIEILKEIIRITDRKHPLWDKAKDFLK